MSEVMDKVIIVGRDYITHDRKLLHIVAINPSAKDSEYCFIGCGIDEYGDSFVYEYSITGRCGVNRYHDPIGMLPENYNINDFIGSIHPDIVAILTKQRG